MKKLLKENEPVFLGDQFIKEMNINFNWLIGKKTYLLGVGAVLYGVLGLLLGYSTLDESKNYIWSGLTAITLRAGISK